jgi:hypothetical protein
VSENRVLRRIYGPKRDEVTGGWRKLHNEELHNLYSLQWGNQNEVKEDEMGRACSMHGEKRNECRIMVGRPEGNVPLGRSRRGWGSNIKIDLREIGWIHMN